MVIEVGGRERRLFPIYLIHSRDYVEGVALAMVRYGTCIRCLEAPLQLGNFDNPLVLRSQEKAKEVLSAGLALSPPPKYF
jgi:hypothetical protein